MRKIILVLSLFRRCVAQRWGGEQYDLLMNLLEYTSEESNVKEVHPFSSTAGER